MKLPRLVFSMWKLKYRPTAEHTPVAVMNTALQACNQRRERVSHDSSVASIQTPNTHSSSTDSRVAPVASASSMMTHWMQLAWNARICRSVNITTGWTLRTSVANIHNSLPAPRASRICKSTMTNATAAKTSRYLATSGHVSYATATATATHTHKTHTQA